MAEEVLGKVFQELVEVDEQGTVTRQRALRERVTQSADAEKLVDALITARLLVAGEGNQPVVEVAHEALLKSWPRLADWIKDTQEDLRLLRQMKLAVVEWERHGRDADYTWPLKRLVPVEKMLERLQIPLNEAERLFMRPVDRRRLTQLLGKLDDLNIAPIERAAIADLIAEIGDTRPGVGLRPDSLPDLLWVRIPGTATVQASGQFPAFPNSKAFDRQLEIADFELAVYPVTIAQFRPFVEQGGYQDDRYWSGAGRRWRAHQEGPGPVPGYWAEHPTETVANHPVEGAFWYEAEAYCAWLNEHLPADQAVRMPTDAEWEWAARGPEGRYYPWGNEPPEGCCNCTGSGIGRTCAVGIFPKGASNWWQAIWPERDVVQDLVGNVWEWTDCKQSFWSAAPGVTMFRPQVLRGGSSSYRSDRGATPRYGNDPRHELGPLMGGFRLARTLNQSKPLSKLNPDEQEDALVSIVEKIEDAFLLRSLPAIQNIHGWSTQQVQALQQQTALVLKVSVEFHDTFKNGSQGPTMLVIPASEFLMGSPVNKHGFDYREEPQHKVVIAKPFGIGRYAVTFDEYDRFCEATGREKPGDKGWGRAQRPVINVTWDDAVAYCAWLSQETGAAYRLPSEAEWEYAAWAGTTTAFWWGDDIDTTRANYSPVYRNGPQGEDRQQTVPVDAFQPNPFGLYQVHGNVWEWVQDNWHEDYYEGAPVDGSAWVEVGDAPWARRDCVLRGGSWDHIPEGLRGAARTAGAPYNGYNDQGFRLARTFSL